MTTKSQLLSLIALHCNPKTWTKIVKNDITIMKEISPIMEKFGLSIPAAAYCYINDYTPTCPNGNQKKFTWFAQGFIYCGKRDKCKCHADEATAKAKATNLIKYGVESYAQTDEYHIKSKETSLKKFGVEYSSYSEENRIRAKNTCLTRFGTENPMQLLEIKNKIKATKLERYNNEKYINFEKRADTLQKKYGVTNPNYIVMSAKQKEILFSEEKFQAFITGKSRQFAAESLLVDPNTINRYSKLYNCEELFTISQDSKWEQIISEYLDELGIKYIRKTKKIIPPYELDFFLPEFKVAIELNGNYWHSESQGKDRQYHYNKWKWCSDLGIDLYQYFEDELINSLDIIKSKIRYLTKNVTTTIGARSVRLAPLQYKEESEFLNLHHIQGASKSRNGSIGAYYENKLVGVLSWLKRKQYLEITRFSTDTSACYPGLFSKMLKYLIIQLQYSGKIVSFSNNCHSNGNLYKASGFEKDSILLAAYWYTKNYIVRENRQKYMKSKIAKRFNVDVKDKTEFQLMYDLGYDKIWDAGKIKWVLNLKKE